MSKIAFSRSFDNGFVRSLCQARTRGYTDAKVWIATAAVPVFGFGTFNALSVSGSINVSIVYNYVWPFVYSTLTETWVSTAGPTRTRVSAYSPYWDIGFYVVSDTGAISVFSGAFTTSTLTGTTFIGVAPSSGSDTVTYTATLSGGPFDPVTSWNTLTAQSLSLLTHISYTDISSPAAGSQLGPNHQVDPSTGYAIDPSVSGVLIVPISAGVGYQKILQAPLFPCAAARGLGVLNGNPSTPDSQFLPFDLCIQDTPNRGTAFPIAKETNLGFIVSIKTWWRLNGSPLYPATTSVGWNLNNHNVVYEQEMTVDPSTGDLAMGSVAPSANFTNPLGLPKTINFNPSDLTAIYGIAGFRSAGV